MSTACSPTSCDLLYNRLEYVMEEQRQALKADLLDAEMEKLQRDYVTR